MKDQKQSFRLYFNLNRKSYIEIDYYLMVVNHKISPITCQDILQSYYYEILGMLYQEHKHEEKESLLDQKKYNFLIQNNINEYILIKPKTFENIILYIVSSQYDIFYIKLRGRENKYTYYNRHINDGNMKNHPMTTINNSIKTDNLLIKSGKKKIINYLYEHSLQNSSSSSSSRLNKCNQKEFKVILKYSKHLDQFLLAKLYITTDFMIISNLKQSKQEELQAELNYKTYYYNTFNTIELKDNYMNKRHVLIITYLYDKSKSLILSNYNENILLLKGIAFSSQSISNCVYNVLHFLYDKLRYSLITNNFLYISHQIDLVKSSIFNYFLILLKSIENNKVLICISQVSKLIESSQSYVIDLLYIVCKIYLMLHDYNRIEGRSGYINKYNSNSGYFKVMTGNMRKNNNSSNLSFKNSGIFASNTSILNMYLYEDNDNNDSNINESNENEENVSQNFFEIYKFLYKHKTLYESNLKGFNKLVSNKTNNEEQCKLNLNIILSFEKQVNSIEKEENSVERLGLLLIRSIKEYRNIFDMIKKEKLYSFLYYNMYNIKVNSFISIDFIDRRLMNVNDNRRNMNFKERNKRHSQIRRKSFENIKCEKGML